MDAAPFVADILCGVKGNFDPAFFLVHFEEFQILEINGRPIEPGSLLNSRKDTIWLGPNQTVKLYFRFRDFHGRYVLHCHNVVHEDHAMMLRWDILTT